MKIALAAFVVGLGSHWVAPSTSVTVVADTCTTAVVCQVSSTISGSWTVTGESIVPGFCKCDTTGEPPDCLTKHCKVKATATSGSSHKVNGGGPCQGSQASVDVDIKSCGNASGRTLLVFTSTDCSGEGTWMTYMKSCSDDMCGDFLCQ